MINLSKFRWVFKTAKTGVPYREADISLLFQHIAEYCSDFQVTVRSYPNIYTLAFRLDVYGDPGEYTGDNDYITPVPDVIYLFAKMPHLEFDMDAEAILLKLAERLIAEVEKQTESQFTHLHNYPLQEPTEEQLEAYYNGERDYEPPNYNY